MDAQLVPAMFLHMQTDILFQGVRKRGAFLSFGIDGRRCAGL